MFASRLPHCRHADPYRIFARIEMSLGNFADARSILYRGARATSLSSDGGLGNRIGMAELYYTWAVCEWHLDNLSRSEVLFDHALRLTSSGADGSVLRSYILYAIARLELDRGEYLLAQHCVCLCLKENSLPGGSAKVWKLWAEIASDLGDVGLVQQCKEQASRAEVQEERAANASLSMLMAIKNADGPVMNGADVQNMMRKDPWHYRIFDRESSSASNGVVGISLPGDT